MKLVYIFSIFTLSVMVKGNLIAVAQPVILTLTTLFTAIDKGIPLKSIEWKNFMPFIKKQANPHFEVFEYEPT